jgi:hypothetical protein
LYVAARLDIATVVGDAKLTVDAIANRIAAQPDAVYRLLRLLAAIGIFEELSPRVFGNNRLSAYLREDHPQSVRAMILMHNSAEISRPWYEQLEQGVRSGGVPFQLTHGEELYPYMDEHPSFDALFSRAMDSVEALIGDSFATDFDWSRFARVIDVGGSSGSKSLAILKRHSRLRALVVDREQTIRTAKQYWEAREDPALLRRLNFQAGDLFASLPAAEHANDIYLLSAVLHGFDDSVCVQGLRNLVRVIAGTGARIALLELIMPEVRPDFSSTAIDMQMFVCTRGRERTLVEWRSLFERSGLTLEEVVELRSFGKLLVLSPRR